MAALTYIELQASIRAMIGSSRQAGPRMTIQTLAVLQVMLDTPADPRYGLQIASAIGLPTGTVYPILLRLERAGWVSSSWEEISPSAEGRPRRRLYTLTGAGVHAARAALSEGRRLLAPAHGMTGTTLRPGESPA